MAEVLDSVLLLQVASPVVYRLSKRVVLHHVQQQGSELNKRTQQRSLYPMIHSRIEEFLELKPQSECISV